MTERILTDDGQDLRYIDENYKYIKNKIEEAALRSGRSPAEVRFMAVTKTVAPYIINRAIACGADLIGENKVQELLSKLDDLHTQGLEMHIIGHLQSNKVKKIITTVAMIQSVDSVSLAEEISKRAVENGVVMDVLTEVNIGCEWSKTGFACEELTERSLEIDALPGVNVRGYMAIWQTLLRYALHGHVLRLRGGGAGRLHPGPRGQRPFRAAPLLRRPLNIVKKKIHIQKRKVETNKWESEISSEKYLTSTAIITTSTMKTKRWRNMNPAGITKSPPAAP